MIPAEARGKGVRVFISYSHDSLAHKAEVRKLADILRANGVDAWIDDYETSPEKGWPLWMIEQITTAEFVLVVCSNRYEQRFLCQQDAQEVGGAGATWEGAVITSELYDAKGRNRKFIPVVVETRDKEFVPIPLRSATTYNLRDSAQFQKLYFRIIGYHAGAAPPIGEVNIESFHPTRMDVAQNDRIDYLPRAKARQSKPKSGEDAQRMMEIIRGWAEHACLWNYKDIQWTLIYRSSPAIYKDYRSLLVRTPEWIATRIFPRKYFKLRTGLVLYSVILDDFLNEFASHSGLEGEYVEVSKYYLHVNKGRELAETQFEAHCDTIIELFTELTKAMNWICSIVRNTLDESFHKAEGLLLMPSDLAVPPDRLLREELSSIYERGKEGTYPGRKEIRRRCYEELGVKPPNIDVEDTAFQANPRRRKA